MEQNEVAFEGRVRTDVVDPRRQHPVKRESEKGGCLDTEKHASFSERISYFCGETCVCDLNSIKRKMAGIGAKGGRVRRARARECGGSTPAASCLARESQKKAIVT